eukprot:8824755-Alexandrium_andersonii.AAC.1
MCSPLLKKWVCLTTSTLSGSVQWPADAGARSSHWRAAAAAWLGGPGESLARRCRNDRSLPDATCAAQWRLRKPALHCRA